MSLDPWEKVLYVVLLTEGIVTIIGALLQRAGSTSFLISRGVKQRPMPFLLLGAAMALGSITMLMPRRPSTHIWLGVLDWVVLCLGIASLVGMVRRKRLIPDSV
jgi:hypothetical protein